MRPEDVTWYDIFVNPAVRDWYILLPGLAFWFLVQHGSRWVLKRRSPAFRALSDTKQVEFCGRVVAVVNGLVCAPSAYLWWYAADALGDDMYKMYDDYRVSHALIVTYFLWDVIVCFIDGWDWLFKMHALASFGGTYFLAFPSSHRWAPYFTGCFELSNAFIHGSEMVTALGGNKQLAFALKGIFCVMFFLIRLIGGTTITAVWTKNLVERFMAGEVHSYSICIIMTIQVWIVVLCQFLWFGEVVKGIQAIFGWGAATAQPAAKTAKPPKGPKTLQPHGTESRPRA